MKYRRHSRPSMDLLKKLVLRLMTRNEPDRVKAIVDRAQLDKNLLTLGTHPEKHLVFVLRIMDKLREQEKEPGFETGLMFGVTMTLASMNDAGRTMLGHMLADIEKQQDDPKQLSLIDEPKQEALST